MFDDPGDTSLQIDFVLVPNFSMMALTSAVEPLRSANRAAERTLYQWRILSRDGDPVAASNGVEVLSSGLGLSAKRSKMVILVSGADVQNYEDEWVAAFMRRMARQGAIIGALCTGSYLLARAGLLDNRRCAVHWEKLNEFAEEFPEIEVSSNIYEIDQDRVTCSGGTAALDMMLDLIGQHHGQTIANDVSAQFIHDRLHEPQDHKRMELLASLGGSHPKLVAVISEMEGNLEEPLNQTELAQRVNLSTRQLERLFRKYLGATPTRYYLNLRLQRSRQLLLQTPLSILSAALACGFVSASHFSKCYREYFGKSPRAERLVKHATTEAVQQDILAIG
jgi:transcriptional regulator GlxA family with amidase domain